MKLTEQELRAQIRQVLINEGIFDFEDSPVLQTLGIAPKAKASVPVPKQSEDSTGLKLAELGIDINDKISGIIIDYCLNFNPVMTSSGDFDIRYKTELTDIPSSINIDNDMLKKIRIDYIAKLSKKYFKEFDLDDDGFIGDQGDYDISLLAALKPELEKAKETIIRKVKSNIESIRSNMLITNHDYNISKLVNFLVDQTSTDKQILDGVYTLENDTLKFHNHAAIIVPGSHGGKFNSDAIKAWGTDPASIEKFISEVEPGNDRDVKWRIIGFKYQISYGIPDFDNQYKFDNQGYDDMYTKEIDRLERIAIAKGKDPQLVVKTKQVAARVYDDFKPHVELASIDKPLPYNFKDFKYSVFAKVSLDNTPNKGMNDLVNKTFLAFESFYSSLPEPTEPVQNAYEPRDYSREYEGHMPVDSQNNRNTAKSERHNTRMTRALTSSVQDLKTDINDEMKAFLSSLNKKEYDEKRYELSQMVRVINTIIHESFLANREVRNKMKFLRNYLKGHKKSPPREVDLSMVKEIADEAIALSKNLDNTNQLVVKESFQLTSKELRAIIKSSF
jgi:hypothetical protein